MGQPDLVGRVEHVDGHLRGRGRAGGGGRRDTGPRRRGRRTVAPVPALPAVPATGGEGREYDDRRQHRPASARSAAWAQVTSAENGHGPRRYCPALRRMQEDDVDFALSATAQEYVKRLEDFMDSH